MQEETISILYQRTQNCWKKNINLRIKSTAKPNEMSCTSGTSGRRKLAFEDSSERSKRRKSKDLGKTVCFPELAHATKMSLRSAGKAAATKLCNEVVFNKNICR